MARFCVEDGNRADRLRHSLSLAGREPGVGISVAVRADSYAGYLGGRESHAVVPPPSGAISAALRRFRDGRNVVTRQWHAAVAPAADHRVDHADAPFVAMDAGYRGDTERRVVLLPLQLTAAAASRRAPAAGSRLEVLLDVFRQHLVSPPQRMDGLRRRRSRHLRSTDGHRLHIHEATLSPGAAGTIVGAHAVLPGNGSGHGSRQTRFWFATGRLLALSKLRASVLGLPGIGAVAIRCEISPGGHYVVLLVVGVDARLCCPIPRPVARGALAPGPCEAGNGRALGWSPRSHGAGRRLSRPCRDCARRAIPEAKSSFDFRRSSVRAARADLARELSCGPSRSLLGICDVLAVGPRR